MVLKQDEDINRLDEHYAIKMDGDVRSGKASLHFPVRQSGITKIYYIDRNLEDDVNKKFISPLLNLEVFNIFVFKHH